jgi:hypothetical protein
MTAGRSNFEITEMLMVAGADVSTKQTRRHSSTGRRRGGSSSSRPTAATQFAPPGSSTSANSSSLRCSSARVRMCRRSGRMVQDSRWPSSRSRQSSSTLLSPVAPKDWTTKSEICRPNSWYHKRRARCSEKSMLIVTRLWESLASSS